MITQPGFMGIQIMAQIIAFYERRYAGQVMYFIAIPEICTTIVRKLYSRSPAELLRL